jgi:rod shape-determining protein MreD
MPYSETSGDRIMAAHQRGRIAQFRAWVLILVPFGALVFQAYVPLFYPPLAYLDLTLLVTIYFAMMRHSPVNGIIVGCSMGLAQDALAHNPLGMYGIAKTLVGFFAASIGVRIDVSQPFVRLLACVTFYMFHQFLFWLISRALLEKLIDFDWRQTLILSGFNAVVGLALFHFLDKLKEKD